jgi:hypothetical protein
MTPDLKVLTADSFEPYLGQTFRVEGGDFMLKLDQVDRLPMPAGLEMPRPPFILIFSAPSGEILAEGMRAITADDGADFTLYLMPIHTPNPGRQDYQAMFN